MVGRWGETLLCANKKRCVKAFYESWRGIVCVCQIRTEKTQAEHSLGDSGTVISSSQSR